MRRGAGSRSVLVALLVALAAAVLAPAAGAHAVPLRTDPVDGASLERAPRAVQVWFDEAISPDLRSVRVIDDAGRPVAGVVVPAPGGDRRVLRLDLPSLPRGPYAVRWAVLSRDGHVSAGLLAFGVGVAAPAVAHGPRRPATSVLESVVRWLGFGLAAALMGALVVGALLAHVRRAGQRTAGVEAAADAAAARVLRVGAIAGGLALAVGVVDLVRHADRLQEALPEGASLTRALLETDAWTGPWLAQEVALAGLTVVALVLRRTPPSAGPVLACGYGGALALATVFALAHALGGHAAALPGARAPTVAAQALHLLAATVWVGSLAALLVALLPTRRGRGSAGLAAELRRPFTWIAALGAGAAVATGLYVAGRNVATVDAVLVTTYGRALALKAALIVAVGALGLANAVLLRGGVWTGRGRPRVVPLVLGVELALGAGVVLAAAVMAASAPARGPEFARPRPPGQATVTRQVGDLLVSTSVRPNRPGLNAVTVIVASTRRPAPAPVESVALRLPLRGAPPLELVREQGWRFIGTVGLAGAGLAEGAVEIGRGGERLRAPVSWSVDAPDPARPVVVSRRPLHGLFDRSALLVALLLVAVPAAALARGRIHRPFGLRRPIEPLREESAP